MAGRLSPRQRFQRAAYRGVAFASVLVGPVPGDTRRDGEARLHVILDGVDLERDGRDALGTGQRLLHDLRARVGGAGESRPP